MSSMHELPRRQPLAWVLIATLLAAAFVWACSDAAGPQGEPDPTQNASNGSVVPSDKPDGASVGDSAPPQDGALPDAPVTTDATEANFKVAFIGDTGTGADFRSVLQLIKREQADLVMVQGDLNYALLGRASAWFSVIDSEINAKQPGSPATVTIPYFVAKGNHDVDWAGYGAGIKTRMAAWGITPDDGDATKVNYSITYKGLKVVMVDDNETTPSRADYVNAQLAGDTHLWKICSWHKNQRNANIGPKSDEMGWAIYENCRNQGAIVAQAHSHTYSRSKTLSNDTAQTVDSACSDPFDLCVGKGKHFFFDSSVGGQDTRGLDTTIAAKAHWGSTYTGSFGALFIEFNVGGDPKKARGYFKTTGDVVVDPPASSGKTTFAITRTP